MREIGSWGVAGLDICRSEAFSDYPCAYISQFMGVASSGGLCLMNVLIFIKCMTGVSFLHRARELLTEVTYFLARKQKCPFTPNFLTEVSFSQKNKDKLTFM